MDPGFIKAAGKDAAGIMTNDSPWQSDKLKPEFQKLREEYGKRFTKYTGRPITGPSVRAFVSTNVLLTEVLSKTGSTDPDKIADAAMKVDIPFGSTLAGWGVKFDQNHQNVRARNAMYQIRPDGQVAVVWPPDFASAEPTMIPLPAWDKR